MEAVQKQKFKNLINDYIVNLNSVKNFNFKDEKNTEMLNNLISGSAIDGCIKKLEKLHDAL